MIRGLYQHLDTHLTELEEKFKKDEITLRNKVDLEIKSQMAQKLKELKYTQTDLYRGDFLYELGKLTIFRDLRTALNYTASSYSIYNTNPISYKFDKKIDGESNELWTDICNYAGFFNNISKLNADKLLRDDEHIVGISGKIIFSGNNNSCKKLSSLEIKVISNYLNYYEVIHQYGSSNTMVINFNERYQLKCIRKNDMKMFDNQIDIISSTFYKLDIYIPDDKFQLYTSYDLDSFNMIELNQEKENFEKKMKTYNYQTLPKECRDVSIVPETDDEKLACCQKCHNTLNGNNRSEFQRRNDQINRKIHEATSKANIKTYDPTIFNSLTTTGDFSILRQSKHKDDVIFMIFEKWFNDFWADKIEDISGDSIQDISIADLIEHKDEIIKTLSTEKKTLLQRIKLLEEQHIQNKKCSEYETKLKTQIKTLKGKITSMETEYTQLIKDKGKIDVNYQELKNKLSSLL
jgi:hypothetical protein